MPHGVERKAGEPVGDEFRLALTARRKGSVGETVLGVLMFTVSDQIYVMRHKLARFIDSVRRDSLHPMPGM